VRGTTAKKNFIPYDLVVVNERTLYCISRILRGLFWFQQVNRLLAKNNMYSALFGIPLLYRTVS
jgi:hypothetical protein